VVSYFNRKKNDTIVIGSLLVGLISTVLVMETPGMETCYRLMPQGARSW